MNKNDVHITINKCRYEELLKKEIECMNLPSLNIRVEFITPHNNFSYHCSDREFDNTFSKICQNQLVVLNNKLEEINTLYNKIPWWKKLK